VSTFTWTPEFSASKASKPTVKQIKYGDGYEQRISFGVNTNPKNWTLRFVSRSDAEANAIESFLDTNGGISSFSWTPPLASVSGRYVCRSWTRTLDKNNLNTISAIFEQVFEP
jgi:phage-related protein